MPIIRINERRLILAIITELLLYYSVMACRERRMIRIGISEYDKKVILEMHNRYRQTVAMGQIRGQPPAANMMEMKWDDELAFGAQKWATSCFSNNQHDAHRHISRFLVGQNMAEYSTTKAPSSDQDLKPNFVQAIIGWFNEYPTYHYGGNINRVTGHYSQIIWAETSAIGCGFVMFQDPVKGFAKNYVCNYGPSGNVIGHLPYRKGYPNCFAYGLQNSKRYYGLCDYVDSNFKNYDHFYITV